MFDADTVPGSDIDIIVRGPGGVLIGNGFNGNSTEEVNIANPAPGTYTVEVAGFLVATASPFKLHSWVLGGTLTNDVAASRQP